MKPTNRTQPSYVERIPNCDGAAHRALRQRFETETVAEHEASQRRAAVAKEILARPAGLNARNFTQIAGRDVVRMVEAIDETWFDGGLQRCLQERGAHLHASLCTRMTSTGGKTLAGCYPSGAWFFEIRLAVTPLYRSFRDDEPTATRDILVNGIACHDRLSAALIVLEHEVLHVAELLCYTVSACHAPRFQQAANRLFGHTSHKHQLVSSLERAAVAFGVRPGSRVAFEFEGQRIEGRVTRIVKRATVLVPDEHGALYSDGQRYRKYYVPLPALTPLD